VAEFENSVFTASALGARRERPALLGPQATPPPEEAGERVAERLGRFLAAGGALEGRMAERLLCRPSSAPPGWARARAPRRPATSPPATSAKGWSPLGHAGPAHAAGEAVVDGAVGEEGVVVVAPAG